MSVGSPHPWVDTSRFPVVVITFPPVSGSADARELTVGLRSFAERLREPIALLNDLSQLRATDPDARAIHAQFVRSMRESARHQMRAVAVVMTNAFQRTMFDLHVTFLGMPPCPLRAFASRADAFAWLSAQLG